MNDRTPADALLPRGKFWLKSYPPARPLRLIHLNYQRSRRCVNQHMLAMPTRPH